MIMKANTCPQMMSKVIIQGRPPILTMFRCHRKDKKSIKALKVSFLRKFFHANFFDFKLQIQKIKHQIICH